MNKETAGAIQALQDEIEKMKGLIREVIPIVEEMASLTEDPGDADLASKCKAMAQ